ncbi:MAG: hypothetical protein Q9187_005766 [Circinaria calcarea]
MASRSRILELASIIQQHTAELDSYLSSQGLPSPSFGIDAPPIIPLPEKQSAIQEAILDATGELQALVAGPLNTVIRITSPTVNILMGLQAIHRFKIAHSLGLNEQVSFAELGQRCGLSTSDTRRFLRCAIVNRIFQEPQKDIVAHNGLSKLLIQVPLLNEWIGLVCDEMWPSGTRAVEAMVKWPGSEEPQHTGFTLAKGINGSFFDLMKQDPQQAQKFAAAMQFLQMAPELSVSHLINGLGWDSENCPALMVDIGGSHGSICMELLKKYPSLKCIVQDFPEVIADAKAPADLADRLSFQGHNFFSEQTVQGADVYFLRSVLHDWSDKYAIMILKNIVPALKHGAKIIMNEVCLPPPGILSYYKEQLLRGYDLSMKQQLNSKEREGEEWAGLLQQVDPKLKLIAIKNSPQSLLSIIKTQWEGETSYQ